MKRSRILAALVAFAALLAPIQASSAESSPTGQSTQIAETAQAAATRQSIAGHLQPDGTTYGYAVYNGQLEKSLQALTRHMAETVGNDPEGKNYKQDYAALATELGLTQITGIGYSSAPRAGSEFENRIFFAIDGPRRGLLAITGGKPHAFDTVRYAPAGTDLFIETDLNLAAAAKSVLAVISKISPETVADYMSFDKLVAATDSPGRFARIPLSMNGRLTLILRGNPLLYASSDTSLQTNNGTSLGDTKMQGLLRVENIGKLAMDAFMGPETAQKYSRKTEGKMEIFSLKEEAKGMLPDGLSPLMAIEGDTLYLATSEDFFNECLKQTTNLSQTNAYKQAMTELGTEGNSLVFITPSLVRYIHMAPAQALGYLSTSKRLTLDEFLSVIPAIEMPIISISSNLPDGILIRTWSPRTLITEQAGLALLHPGFTADLFSRIIIATYASGAEERQNRAHTAAIEKNLTLIDEKARAYFGAHPDETTVSFDDLAKTNAQIESLKAIAGENYHDLTIQRASDVLEIYADFGNVRYVHPLTEDEQAAIRHNLAQLDEATAHYFAETPDATYMNTYVASKYITIPPDGLPVVAGEDYSDVRIEKTDTQISITTRGGQTVTYERDASLYWKTQKQRAARQFKFMRDLSPAFAAAQKYFSEQTNDDITLSDLIRDQLVARPDGLSDDVTDQIVFHRNSYQTIFTQDGREVTIQFPLPTAQRETILANLNRVGTAARDYLKKNPDEIMVFAMELAQMKSSGFKLPDPVVGENYEQLSLNRGDETLSITLPTGHTLTVPIVW